MARTAVIALEDNNPISDLEVRPRKNINDSSYTLVTEVLWIVMELEVMLCPDAGAFEANRRYRSSNNAVAAYNPGVRTFHQCGSTGLRNC